MQSKCAALCALLLLLAGAAHAETAATPATLFAEADQHFQKGEYETALSGYRAVIERYPNDWHATQARFTEGFILQKKMGKLKQAREAFQHVAEKETSPALAENALFHIASVDEKSGDTDKAMQGFTEVLKRGKFGREKNATRRLALLRAFRSGKKDPPPGWAQGLSKRWWRKRMR